jgi:hypothetical protein
MNAKKKKVGFYAPVVNIFIYLVLIGLVGVMLFGQTIIDKYLTTYFVTDGAVRIEIDRDIAEENLAAGEEVLFFVLDLDEDGNIVDITILCRIEAEERIEQGDETVKNSEIRVSIILHVTEGIAFNLAALQGYLPLDDDGVVNNITHYNIGGIILEPQAIVLQLLLLLLVIGVALNVWRACLLFPYMLTRNKHRIGELYFGKIKAVKAGAWVYSVILMLFTVLAFGLFIFTYGVVLDVLFVDIQAFFREVFSAGLIPWTERPEAGALLMMMNYGLVAMFGVSSFVVTWINR